MPPNLRISILSIPLALFSSLAAYSQSLDSQFRMQNQKAISEAKSCWSRFNRAQFYIDKLKPDSRRILIENGKWSEFSILPDGQCHHSKEDDPNNRGKYIKLVDGIAVGKTFHTSTGGSQVWKIEGDEFVRYYKNFSGYIIRDIYGYRIKQ